MNIHERFNADALRVWRRYCPEPTLMPSHYSRLARNLKLLVLGMNPSFGAKWIQREIHKRTLGENTETLLAEEIYGWHPENGARQVQHLHTMEDHAFKNYQPYFGPMKKFAEAVGCSDSYGHLDLFHVRGTKQRDFLSRTVKFKKDGSAVLSEFGQAQVALTRQTLQAMQPMIVVIANATASHLAPEVLKLTLVPGMQTQYTMAELPDTRFFLAGMLSGGRAMDTYSRIRLEEEVRGYLRNRAPTTF